MTQMLNWLTFGCSTERDRRNQRRVNLWGLAWMISWLSLNLLLEPAPAWATPAVIIGLAMGTALLGLGMLRAYRRFIGQADELLRKIELDALALAFGVGIVAAMTLQLLGDVAGLTDAGLAEIVALMMVVYALGVIGGHRQYSA